MSSSFVLFLIFLKILVCLGEKPVIQDLFVSSKLVEGKRSHLTCQLNSGKQPITWSWYHADELVKSSDKIAVLSGDDSSQLTIKEMSLADSGQYVCKVENAYGSDTRRVDLKLNGKF